MLPDDIRNLLTDQEIQYLEEAIRQHKSNKGPANSVGTVGHKDVISAMGLPTSEKQYFRIPTRLKKLALIYNVRGLNTVLGGPTFQINPDLID